VEPSVSERSTDGRSDHLPFDPRAPRALGHYRPLLGVTRDLPCQEWTDHRSQETGAIRLSDLDVRLDHRRLGLRDAVSIVSSGRLITESLKDYSRKTVLTEYPSLDGFLSAWTTADRKQVVLEELALKGFVLDELADQVGRDYDAFDLICHIAFDKPPLTRKERADNVKKRDVFTKCGDKAKAVLEALLEKFSDSGLPIVESLDILKVQPISGLGTLVKIIK